MEVGYFPSNSHVCVFYKKTSCEYHTNSASSSFYGFPKCMMIRHSKTDGCDLYKNDCSCKDHTGRDKHLVKWKPMTPNDSTKVVVDSISGKITIDTAGWGDVTSKPLQYRVTLKGGHKSLTASHFAIINVSKKCCVFSE